MRVLSGDLAKKLLRKLCGGRLSMREAHSAESGLGRRGWELGDAVSVEADHALGQRRSLNGTGLRPRARQATSVFHCRFARNCADGRGKTDALQECTRRAARQNRALVPDRAQIKPRAAASGRSRMRLVAA
ncbi:hypothetical protein L1887_53603 [Cichorium endivia]|nr:hypothetical protein L1887_53603 [Cichorium endivia]